MNRIFGLGAALAVVLASGTAFAADLGTYAPAPAFTAPAAIDAVAPTPVAADAYDWTGAYIGVTGAYGWGESEQEVGGVKSGLFDTEGYLLGGTIGYNYQLENGVVLGTEAELMWSDVEGSGFGRTTDLEWVGTAGVRAGYAIGNFLPYVKAGLAVGDVKGTAAGYDDTERQLGLVAAAGLEVGLTENVTARAEYQYLGFNTDRVFGDDFSQDVDSWNHALKTGLAFKF